MRWRSLRRDDQGIATIFIVMAAPALLMMGALVFDGARGVIAQRDAQNAADAAALASAIDCSNGGSCTASAAGNYKGPATVVSASCGASTCTATMSETVNYAFAPGGPGVATKSATATWGALGGSTGLFPLAVSTCSFSGLAYNVKVTLHSYAVPGCSTPSGNFGFIANGCSSSQTIAAGQNIGGTTGNNLGGTGCSDLNGYLNKDVLVPVWDTQTGSGSSGTYHIYAYAVFYLTGWSTNGNNFGGTLGKQCDASGDGGVNESVNMPCVRGYFKGFTTQVGTLVPGLTCKTNLLACEVYLSS